jgi:hypothetical protein
MKINVMSQWIQRSPCVDPNLVNIYYFKVSKKIKIIHTRICYLDTYSYKFKTKKMTICDLHKKEKVDICISLNSIDFER